MFRSLNQQESPHLRDWTTEQAILWVTSVSEELGKTVERLWHQIRVDGKKLMSVQSAEDLSELGVIRGKHNLLESLKKIRQSSVMASDLGLEPNREEDEKHERLLNSLFVEN